MKKALLLLLTFSVFLSLSSYNVSADDQSTAKKVPHGPPPEDKIQIPSAESLGKGKFRIGNITVDTANKEVIIPGRLNMNEGTIEYIASVKGGFKLYETVLELDANAYEFNLSLILIGLDQSKGKASKMHFDPNPPEGDPVEIWVDWTDSGKQKSIRVEDLVYDIGRKAAMPRTKWVYTGSTVLENGVYMAQMDGVLIGFVHDPAAIIDSASDFGLTQYGMLVVNKEVSPPVGTKVRLKVKSLKK
jgi:hypothetical protein